MFLVDGVFLSYLQSSLNNLRKSEEFYDVVLETGGKRFYSHRAILAAASPYFRAMFTARGFKEYEESNITINDIHPNVLGEILNFIYTSKIEISEDNIYLLMAAVDLFEMSSLRVCISKFLISIISMESCLHIYEAASRFNYHDLAEIAFRFCVMNFELILKNPAFLDLPINIIEELISSKLLNVPDENAVLEAVLSWVSDYPEQRKVHLQKLLSYINLRHISADNLTVARANIASFEETVAVLKIEEIMASQQDVQEAIWYLVPRIHRTPRYHLDQEVVLAIGGELNGMAARNVECHTKGYTGWKCVIPEYVVPGATDSDSRVISPMRWARKNAAVAYDGCDTYLIGGETSDTILEACEAYNVVKNQWRPLPALPTPLEGCAATFCEGRIIVTGGKNSTQAYELDPKKWLSWRSLPSLPEPRYNHCSVTLHGYVYVLGGYTTSDTKPTASVLRYDVQCREWLALPDMLRRRACFGAAVVFSTIFVMGGLEDSTVLRNTEKYDPLTNDWLAASDMLVPRYDFAITVKDNRVFCLGGNDSIHRLHTAVQYNPKTDNWHSFDSMQMARVGLVAATVRVPVLRELPR